MRVGNASELVRDRHYLLHDIDVAQDRLIFLPTTRALLERAGFLDGRTAIAAGQPVACSLADALASAPAGAPALPDRFIFHGAFCGSTRLARLLDRPGKAMVLREPNVLVALADWKASLDRRSARDERLAPLVRLACASLQARWEPGEAVVVKPSNWVNNLLGELCLAAPGVRPVFVVGSRRSFLRAAFRGGRDRLAFVARAAAHLAAAHRSDQALLNAAIGAAADPLGRAAHLAAFVHWLQQREFRRARHAGGWGGEHVVAFEAIEFDPHGAAAAAAAALGLDHSPADLAEAVARNAGRDAKNADAAYSPAERIERDRTIDRLHGRHIEAALAWAGDLLPDEEDAASELARHAAERRAG